VPVVAVHHRLEFGLFHVLRPGGWRREAYIRSATLDLRGRSVLSGLDRGLRRHRQPQDEARAAFGGSERELAVHAPRETAPAWADALADVVASVLFADTSGSAVADTAAIGTVMMPGMRARGYDEGFVVAHQAAAGSLGTLFPPSISMIIFATVTSVSVTALFLASLIPGFLVAGTYMLIAYLIARRRGYPREAGVTLRQLGMITLRGSGLQKIRNGVTTIEEVLRETVA